jgi:hypothetical protein
MWMTPASDSRDKPHSSGLAIKVKSDDLRVNQIGQLHFSDGVHFHPSLGSVGLHDEEAPTVENLVRKTAEVNGGRCSDDQNNPQSRIGGPGEPKHRCDCEGTWECGPFIKRR